MLQSLTAGDHLFVFCKRGPLYLVAVSNTGECEESLRQQLTVLHECVISILTDSVEKVFEKNSGYDLRELLGGTEGQLLHLLQRMNHSPAFFLDAVQCHRMNKTQRQAIGDLFYKFAGGKQMLSVVFGYFGFGGLAVLVYCFHPTTEKPNTRTQTHTLPRTSCIELMRVPPSLLLGV